MKIIQLPPFEVVTCGCGCRYELDKDDKNAIIQEIQPVDVGDYTIIKHVDATIRKDIKKGGKTVKIIYTRYLSKCPICGELNLMKFKKRGD